VCLTEFLITKLRFCAAGGVAGCGERTVLPRTMGPHSNDSGQPHDISPFLVIDCAVIIQDLHSHSGAVPGSLQEVPCWDTGTFHELINERYNRTGRTGLAQSV
jgi:hypothetical protein